MTVQGEEAWPFHGGFRIGSPFSSCLKYPRRRQGLGKSKNYSNNVDMEKTLLIFGFGYTARAFAASLVQGGWRVIGTTRDGLETVDGCEIVKWPGTDMRAVLRVATHLLISIAPNENGDPVLKTILDQVSEIAQDLVWAGYLSTTGVYGDHQGDWVDETSQLSPATRRGELRVQAEAEWQALATQSGLALHIFRLAGIYGPDRGPLTKIKQGTARRIVKPGQVFSRIHVDDIVQVLIASIAQPNPGRIYNVCDDLAAPPEDVLGFAAMILGLPMPAKESYATADMTTMARSFYAESKRVSNERIKTELGVVLGFPTYREGLRNLSGTKC